MCTMLKGETMTVFDATAPDARGAPEAAGFLSCTGQAIV